MTKVLAVKDKATDFLIYTTPEGNVKIEAFLHDENIWLTQKRMAELFGVTIPTVNEHLKNILSSGELDEYSVIRKFLTTASDGKKYQTKFYNLNAIISVGYRVNSKQATFFRIWATKVLKEFVIKGFALDDSRLKNGQYFGKITILPKSVKRSSLNLKPKYFFVNYRSTICNTSWNASKCMS